MSQAPRLELRQRQQLSMTQQLRQSIELLQLSSQELQAFVAEEMEQNPILARDESQGEGAATEGQPAEANNRQPEESWDDVQQGAADRPEDRESRYQTTGSGAEGGAGSYIDALPDESFSLHRHLQRQIALELADPREKVIAERIVEQLDSAGYWQDNTQNLAKLLGCEAKQVEEVLRKVQQFDPPGIAARSLQECLERQLEDREWLDPPMQCLLEHLELVGKGELDKLARNCKIGVDEIKTMLGRIRQLDPKPGYRFHHDVLQPIQPDVIVRTAPHGWQVELNCNVLPKVLVNQRYFSQLTEQSRGETEKRYLSDQLGRANWLIKSLDQRAQNLLKVSSEIVDRQKTFLRHGIAYLHPLTLREVAEKTELHESTVSRVTANKYIATPRGQFELKFFFGSGVTNELGGDVSARTVQHHIRQLIEKETLDNILSDEALVELLKEQGIEIARRTVAKYREGIGIASSSARRRQKKLADRLQ